MRQATAYTNRAGVKHKHTRISKADITSARKGDINRGSKSQLPKGMTDAAKYWSDADIEETSADYLIPRQSLTVKQHLKMFPTEPVTEDIVVRTFDTSNHHINMAGKIQVQSTATKVINKGNSIVKGVVTPNLVTMSDVVISHDHYVKTTDVRVIRKGEKSLLNRGRAFTELPEQIERGQFKRLTSQTKRIKNERSDNAPIPDTLESVVEIDPTYD